VQVKDCKDRLKLDEFMKVRGLLFIVFNEFSGKFKLSESCKPLSELSRLQRVSYATFILKITLSSLGRFS